MYHHHRVGITASLGTSAGLLAPSLLRVHLVTLDKLLVLLQPVDLFTKSMVPVFLHKLLKVCA